MADATMMGGSCNTGLVECSALGAAAGIGWISQTE